jgi:phospholipid/cholesterol/gamma-HCH transport system substrate-binding protein
VKRRNEVTVGAVILLGTALIVWGTIWMKGNGFGKEKTELHARVSEAGQLLRGGKVKIRGVSIGRVENIALEPGSRGVNVTMTIDHGVTLPEDPVALLSPESMFGDWQVQIFPRSSFPQYPYAESPDPRVLPGYSLPDISRLTAVADQIAGNLAKLSARFEEAFTTETAANVRDAIENIQKVSEQLTGLIERQNKNADQVATSLAGTSDALSNAAETAQRAFAEFESAVGGGKLTSIVSNVQKTSATADSLSRILLKTTQDLHVAAASADTAFRAVGAMAQNVNRGQGTLGKLVTDSAMYFRFIETNAELQALLRDMRANPRRYINLTIF